TPRPSAVAKLLRRSAAGKIQIGSARSAGVEAPRKGDYLMNPQNRFSLVLALVLLSSRLMLNGAVAAQTSQDVAPDATKVISAEDCTSERLGTSIPISAIGERVAEVTLAAPKWVSAANAPDYCSIDGAMAPVDKSSHGRTINFRVVLPASWTRRAAQMGGGGMNGTIPNLTAGEANAVLQRGFA